MADTVVLLQWHAPTPDNKRCLEGTVPLLLVADDTGTHKLDENSYWGDSYGALDVTVDAEYGVVFTYNGGGSAPYDQWTVVYWQDKCTTLEQALLLAQFIFDDIVTGRITMELWDALQFHKEVV